MRTAAALLVLVSLSALPVHAQSCLDNQYPVTFVNAAGQPVPTFDVNGEQVAQFDSLNAYMALSPQMPSGVYYVQVSDSEITTVLATSAQLDRIFEITNNGGVISVVRLSSTPGLPPPGVGLNGVGQSVPLFPLTLPPPTSSPCLFKAWIGTCYSESWNPATDPLGLPWGIQGQDGSGGCCVRSYARFHVGNGSSCGSVNCDGHTPGFWSNQNGRAIVIQNNLLSRLPSLNLRTANGSLFTTTNYDTFRTWLLGATATNMAYKLSSHVVAMDFNIANGFVDGSCMINDPNLGTVSISSVLAQAVTALGADGYTPTGDPNRALQERLKNALDNANNDLNWN